MDSIPPIGWFGIVVAVAFLIGAIITLSDDSMDAEAGCVLFPGILIMLFGCVLMFLVL